MAQIHYCNRPRSRSPVPVGRKWPEQAQFRQIRLHAGTALRLFRPTPCLAPSRLSPMRDGIRVGIAVSCFLRRNLLPPQRLQRPRRFSHGQSSLYDERRRKAGSQERGARSERILHPSYGPTTSCGRPACQFVSDGAASLHNPRKARAFRVLAKVVGGGRRGSGHPDLSSSPLRKGSIVFVFFSPFSFLRLATLSHTGVGQKTARNPKLSVRNALLSIDLRRPAGLVDGHLSHCGERHPPAAGPNALWRQSLGLQLAPFALREISAAASLHGLHIPRLRRTEAEILWNHQRP
jgi:hypothetical protein